jgi:glycosyltransferase involved in cell wall biosynthesis
MGKLLFLARALDFGGAERQLATLASRLHRAGHDVRIAVFYAGGGLEAETRAAGVPIVDLSKGGRWDLLPFLWRLIRLLRAERPAILHGYLTVPNLLAVLLKPCMPGAKVVMGVRASNMELDRYDWLSRLTARVERGVSRGADLIIVNSRAGRDHLLAQGFAPSQLYVVPNGIDTERFRPDPAARLCQRAAWGIGEEERLIGLVARWDPMKDHPNFLRAAARILADHPAARFVCMGGGDPDYRSRLETLAETLGLAGKIAWREPQADLNPVYAALDLLVSASRYGEGFSNVIGEAMATGVPCVVTDVGDSAWIVGETGRVAPPGDAAALAAAVDELLRLPAETLATLSLRARARMVDHFSVEALTKNTLAALATLRDFEPGPADDRASHD